ncbi:hypothetical protein GJAV_G00253300 [Gymnothorax javanicus]|nr:hypothetical protein GJAV_G00253300 [Gymnothorax javanicus]
MMCGQPAQLEETDISLILDENTRQQLEMLKKCATEADLAAVKHQCGDWIAECGVPHIFSASLEDLPEAIKQVEAHDCFHRVASMVHQYTAGTSILWTVLGALWDWSPPGSNSREEEEKTIFQYEDWLVAIEEGEVDAQFKDLLIFVTAADHIPPLGFPGECIIRFSDQEPGTRRLPYASTCAVTLHLPRGIDESVEFRDMMDMALKGSLGFGKV